MIYTDANNLYGYSLPEPLPVGKFRFLEHPENFDVDVVDCDEANGYVLEVDLEYPDHFHDVHNEYPLAPEHMTVTKDMFQTTIETVSSSVSHAGRLKTQKWKTRER